jgi:protein-S-isoprenylcysteine O-methyltransferase Ste14
LAGGEAVGVVDCVHAVVVGSKPRRVALAVVGFVLFSAAVIALVLAALWLDDRLGVEGLFPAGLGLGIGLPLFGAGVFLISWCIALFLSARGTPVPFSPPQDLVVRGPYLRSRNPMLTGLFAALAGAGFVLRSPSLVVLVPIVIVAAWVELKLVEEPELRRRFGASYVEYTRNVPMFLPRLGRRGIPS